MLEAPIGRWTTPTLQGGAEITICSGLSSPGCDSKRHGHAVF